MADKVRLTQLATDIQKAVDAYDPKDMSSHRKIQTALETMQSMICPPEIVMIEQRFRVRSSPNPSSLLLKPDSHSGTN
jgi:hypothetical protein